MPDSLSEKVLEDILSADRSILADLLSLEPSGLSLIARQRELPSGRLDMLWLYENELLLVELKAVPFNDEIMTQIRRYRQDLMIAQREHKLIDGSIREVILVTDATSADASKCTAEGIHLLRYQPSSILSRYFENFKELSYFLKIRSSDYGVVRLGLLKATLGLIGQGHDPAAISRLQGRSLKTIRNRLAVAVHLGLVTKHRSDYFLTEFGNEFVAAGNADMSDRLSDEQVELLSRSVVDNPFHSSITYTILTFVECVFFLAKSSYPVRREIVQDYFVESVGKTETWKADRARRTASYIFSNYAGELGLVARVGNDFYITPRGIQAILVLQLNRSIRLIESQR